MFYNEDFLWTEKYRPKTIEDTILPQNLKTIFQTFIKKGDIPNLLLTGGPGVGKTTVARAMLEEIGCEYIIINGSMNGNIDTLRNDIKQFASSISLEGGRKYVILDEADYLNPNSTQPALRNFMEEFSKNCGFILTCNYKNKIIEPLRSRCSLIEFIIPKSERQKLAAKFFEKTVSILTQEKVEFEPKAVSQLLLKHFPDWRRCINELQKYSAFSKIDEGILTTFEEESIKKLFSCMKDKNFTETRKWISENASEQNDLFRLLYDIGSEKITKKSIPSLVLILSKYQYQSAFAADQEINFAAMCVEIMMECEFL